jgi:hypothetical protein
MLKIFVTVILALAATIAFGAGLDRNWFVRAVGDSCNANEGTGTCQNTSDCKNTSTVDVQAS